MSRRERNIMLAGAAVAVLFLLSQGLPMLSGIYGERQQSIELIRDDIAREERLIEDRELWRERRQEIEAELGSMAEQVFEGSTVPLLTANIQRLVREHANATGVTITATSLAEALETEGWLLVEQELSFTMDQQSNTLGFLRRLEQSRPWLGVTSFTMRRTRNSYAGSITVVGFSRLGGSGSQGQASLAAAGVEGSGPMRMQRSR